jgi:hypothetical protein
MGVILVEDHLWPSFIASLALLALGIFVFVSRPGGPINRSFAFYLTLRGCGMLLFSFAGNAESLASRLMTYPAIALPFVLVYIAYQMLVCYKAAFVRRIPWWVAMGVLGAAAALCEGAYMLNHALVDQPISVPGCEVGCYQSGPLGWWIELDYFASALLVLIFAFAIRSMRLGVARRSLRQGMQAFAIVTMYVVCFMGFGDAVDMLGPNHATFKETFVDFNQLPGDLMLAGALVLLLAALGPLLWPGADPESRAEGKSYAWTLALSSVLGLGTGTMVSLRTLAGPYWYMPHFVIFGCLVLASAALLSVPLLRDHILDVDFRAEATLRTGLTAAMIGTIGFVVVEVTANMLSQQVGLSLGGVAALGMLFFLGPLQHFATKFSSRAVPKSAPLRKMSEAERARIFREQAQLAWSDGTMNRKERLFLDQLGRRLGLSGEQVAKLERESMKDAAAKGGAAAAAPA